MHIIVIDISGKTNVIKASITSNSHEFQTFIANRNHAGDRIIIIENENAINDSDLMDIVSKELNNLSEQYQIKQVNQYVRIYRPWNDPGQGYYFTLSLESDPDSEIEVPFEYMDIKDVGNPNYWSIQDKFYAMYDSSSAIIQKTLLQCASYRKLRERWNDNVVNGEKLFRSAERYHLYDQRFSELYHAISNNDACLSDKGLMTSIKTYHSRWGHTIAVKDPSMTAQLYVDIENQHHINQSEENYLYFRSEVKHHNSQLLLAYIRTFATEYHSKYGERLEPAQCVPIDFDFLELKSILNSNIKMVSVLEEKGVSELTTRDHYILVFESANEASAMLEKIQKLGLLPTPHKMYHRINQFTDNYSLMPLADRHGKSIYRDVQPPEFGSLEELINCTVYQKYKKLALINNPELPFLSIHVNAITSMLEALNHHLKNQSVASHRIKLLKHSYSFIFEHMMFATLYFKDHRRWVNTYEWLMEEITFILAVLEPYGLDDFQSIMRDNMRHCHSDPALLLHVNQNEIAYHFGLYNSGMRACFEALSAARETGGSNAPVVVYLDNIYYETAEALRLFHAEKCSYRVQGKINNPDADIYVMNMEASLAENEENIYSIDVNQFIDELFLSRANSLPVTLILDSTLVDIGGQKVTNILLQQKNKIMDGSLNLVFVHSLQKYGMLGSDKVEAGMVWAVNNPQFFSKYNTVISSTERQNQYFDRQLVCHIAKHAYQSLRQAMLTSFKNGHIIRDILRHNQHSYAIDELDDSPFYFSKTAAQNTNPYRYFLCRSSFGFPHTVATRISNTTGTTFFCDRIAAGMEGESKLNLLTGMADYPHKGRAALIDLIESLCIPELKYTDKDSFSHLLEDVVNVISEPRFRSLLCKQYYKVIVCINGIIEYDDAVDSLPHKTHLFNLLNIVLRIHAVPLPPEIYNKLHCEMNEIKTRTLDGIHRKLVSFSSLPLSRFIQVNKNRIDINIIYLDGLQQILTSYINEQNQTIIHSALNAIDDYLLTQAHAKLQRLPKKMDLAFKICDSISVICTEKHLHDDLKMKLAKIKRSSVEERNPSIIVVGNPCQGHNLNRTVHVFFDKLADATHFVKMAGFENGDTKPADLVDANRRYSRDPIIASMYARYVISISIEKYVDLFLQDANQPKEKRILPVHNSKKILTHCQEAKQYYKNTMARNEQSVCNNTAFRMS
ncbi:Uncharacterised protein [Legionella lansingensis]|uniref:Uncharacterized protein n=1 Tax=Legionella lansingensis TaxID=45067 RepID=A0A0W0VUG7_9GAMM|nr:hypothetical protein [Legionella lansingensis]KTD23803.1 hypothetical protein Llan_0584 [Legionella lansingensis]SNV46960.1 Uncharacterised protein [Legionella lansingensis]